METKDPFASSSILVELGSESLVGKSRPVVSDRIVCNDGNVLYLQYPIERESTSHMWPLSTYNVASVNEELKFRFYFISIQFQLL